MVKKRHTHRGKIKKHKEHMKSKKLVIQKKISTN